MGWRAALWAFAVVTLAGAATLARPAGPMAAPTPTARAAACAPLGVAGDFAVFSDGVFTAEGGGGATITGRIAAASDVKLDGVSVAPGPGDVSPTIITGASLKAGKLGLGGTVSGGVRYAAILDVDPPFTVGAPRNHGAPPFSFANEFQALGLLSDRWSALPPTLGTRVTFNSGILTLHGGSSGLNVFDLTAADVGGFASNVTGVVVELPGPDASALINVNTETNLTLAPQSLTVTPSGAGDRLIWNLPRATALNVEHGVAWKGLILAPNAAVNGANHPQLAGELIAKSVPGGAWTFDHVPLAVCPPTDAPPGPLELTALCVDPFGNLAMRLRNTGVDDIAVHWDDLGGTDFGDIVVPAQRDEFFNVRGGGAHSSIRVTAGRASLEAVAGTDEPCSGELTVTKLAGGNPPPGPWTVKVSGGDGRPVRSAQLGAGQSATFHALGGYQPGTARFGQVVGGIAYTVSEPDPRGGTATIDINPIEILTGEHETVTVANAFPGPGAPLAVPVTTQPTLPPRAPRPGPGPDLVRSAPGVAAANLAVTHSIRPRRVRVGGVIRTVTRVRNRGAVATVGTVLRELPQFRAADANAAADVLSIRTSRGRCTRRRPVRCALGTLAPGAVVTVRTRTRIKVPATLNSVVLASSRSRESNTTDNTAIAVITATAPRPHLRVTIRGPRTGRVGVALRYRVSVTGTRADGARSVRLCAARAPALTSVRAPGTFRDHGARCRDISRLRRGRTVAFDVAAVPAAGGRLKLTARATAVGLGHVARAHIRIRIAPPIACGAGLRPRC